MNARETVFEENVVRIYEYVDLSARDMGETGVSLNAAGWGRYDIETPEDNDRDEGELSYAYLVIPVEGIHSRVSLGRHFVYAGVSSEQVDGVSLSTGLSELGMTLFGGSPPELDFDNRRGDAIYGGRLSHQLSGVYEIGASYVKEDNDGDDFREEYGADLWISPVRWLSLQGASTYNEITSEWMEHIYRLSVGPPETVRVYGEYSEVEYEHFFQTATSSVFSFDWIDPDESYVLTGGGIEIMISSSASFLARYRHYDYDLSGEADTYGGGLTYGGETVSVGVSADRTDGDVDELRYTLYRAYLSLSGEKADLTLDAVQVAYDETREGVDETITATGAIGYRPVKNLRTGIEVTYEENPLFEHETRGLLKIDYRFGKI